MGIDLNKKYAKSHFTIEELVAKTVDIENLLTLKEEKSKPKEIKPEPIKTLTKSTTAQLIVPSVLLSTQSFVAVSTQSQVGISVSTTAVAPIMVVPAPSVTNDTVKTKLEKTVTTTKEEVIKIIKEPIKKK